MLATNSITICRFYAASLTLLPEIIHFFKLWILLKKNRWLFKIATSQLVKMSTFKSEYLGVWSHTATDKLSTQTNFLLVLKVLMNFQHHCFQPLCVLPKNQKELACLLLTPGKFLPTLAFRQDQVLLCDFARDLFQSSDIAFDFSVKTYHKFSSFIAVQHVWVLLVALNRLFKNTDVIVFELAQTLLEELRQLW